MNIIALFLSVLLVLVVCSSSVASAFVLFTPITSNNAAVTALTKNVDKTNSMMRRPVSVVVVGMVGGRGWDNDDYLAGLGGSDEDKNKAQEDYKEFSDRRAAFISRQGEIMSSPQGKAFLMKQQQREQQQQKQQQQMQEDSYDEDMEVNFASKGSGGGTRMGRMMAQAKRMQDQQRSQGGNHRMGGSGFNQHISSPLDDVDEDDDE
jgi:hypothetical protein